jgi:hypothetical protein
MFELPQRGTWQAENGTQVPQPPIRINPAYVAAIHFGFEPVCQSGNLCVEMTHGRIINGHYDSFAEAEAAAIRLAALVDGEGCCL